MDSIIYYYVSMPKKLKVVCLHGYGTNSKFMSRQMRSFQLAFQNEMEFVFLDGPFEAPHSFILDEKVIARIEGKTRAWNPLTSYKYNSNKYFQSILPVLEQLFQKQQYDGIIGFSQGAVFVHLLVKLWENKKISWKGLNSLKFAVLASGNHWGWQNFGLFADSPINLPSIHLISESDFLYRKSIFTTTQFKDPLVIHHAFGHSFPRLGKEEFNLIRKYINNNIKSSGSKEQMIVSKL